MLARIQAGSVSCFSGLSLFNLLVSPSDVSRTPSEQKPAMWRIDLSRATTLCMRPPSGRVVVHKNSDAVLYSLAERPQSARWTTKRDAPPGGSLYEPTAHPPDFLTTATRLCAVMFHRAPRTRILYGFVIGAGFATNPRRWLAVSQVPAICPAESMAQAMVLSAPGQSS